MSKEDWTRGDIVEFIDDNGGTVVGTIDEVLSSQLLVLDRSTQCHVFVFKNDRTLRRHTDG